MSKITPPPPHELEQKLLTTIDKLSDRSTFPQASLDLNFLAKSLPSDSLPTFLSCILSLDTSSKSPVRVHCIALIPVLSNTHKSSLSPHYTKIISFILRRLRDSDTSVRNACVGAVASLSCSTFAALVEPFLGSVSIEQDLNAQIGCCLCLKACIESNAMEECDVGDLRKRVLPKVIKLLKSDGFKAKGGLLGVIESVVGVNDGGVINVSNGKYLVGNVVGVVVEMLSCDDWMARKGAAQVLLKLAIVLDHEFAVDVKGFVVSSLESRRFDKVKVTREIMNRALEAWKEICGGGPDQQLALSRSNSSISKDKGAGGASIPIPRRFSYAGAETPKPKKKMAKCRSSLSDGPFASLSPSMSPSTQDSIGFDTPQRRKTLSKSRSSLSDDSTITDSSSVSNFDVPLPKKPLSKAWPSLPDDWAFKKRSPSKTNDKMQSAHYNTESNKSTDWKVEIAVSPAHGKVVLEDEPNNYIKKTSEERVPKFSAFKHGSRVVPFTEEDEPRGYGSEGGRSEEVSESNADAEDLSLIRMQLLQIERQQSDLLALVQRYMGNSQSGIDSLETRVSGLERALDEISHDLAMQSGRITNNDSAGSTCCPSTEFLSPKFWRRTEGRSFNSKLSSAGNVPIKEANVDTPCIDGYKNSEHSEGILGESWGNVKNIGQNAQRGRNCSPRSFDSSSNPACITSVGRGAYT